MSTSYDADLGLRQGRIQPSGWITPEGSYVFVLGHDTPGTMRGVSHGDEVAIAQTFDLASLPDQPSVIRFRARIRPPAGTAPVAGMAWFFRIIVDGFTIYEVPLVFGARARDLHDLIIPVLDASYPSPLVRLSLQLEQDNAEIVRAELPAVYLDAFTPDSTGFVVGNPIVALRSPEPGETGVPADEAIKVAAVSVYASFGVDSLDVYVNGDLVANTDNGGNVGFLATDWTLDVDQLDGSNSTQPYVTLTPPSGLFEPLQVVTVRTVAKAANPISGLVETTDVTWSYTIADTVGPVLEQALALTMTEVQITFDEPVLQVDAAAAADALNPASYALALIAGAPAVTPAILSVRSTSPNQLVLELDKIMTRRATYRVTALVEDVLGNASAPPTNTATFIGYEEPWPEGRSFNFYEMMPQALRLLDESRDLWKFCAIVQEVIDVQLALADRWLDIIDPDVAPEPWVDAMLTDLGNPFPFALTLLEKRRLVQLLLAIYKTKGTGPGIVDAIRLFLGIEVTINVYAWSPYPIGVAVIGSTWILGSNDADDLRTFQVLVPQFLSAEERARIDAIADYMKVAHERHVIIEPTPPGGTVDHWTIGYSYLGTLSLLH